MRILLSLVLTIPFLSCIHSTHKQENRQITIADTGRNIMTDSTKKDILEQIDLYIKSGFYDKEEIFTNIEDYLYEIPFDHDWTKQQIDKAHAERLKQQSLWPVVTDFDKLAAAFDKLNLSGIIALHNAGMTKQDGEADCEEIHDDLLQQGIKTKGFCYYHWQDIERVVDGSRLYIGFGDFNNNNTSALEIGKQVASALESQGFKLNWKKTAASRIEITNIMWQKRFENDNGSREKAMDLLRLAKK